MKKVALSLALALIAFCSFAQNRPDEAAVKQVWKDIYAAFNAGNGDKGFTYYSEDAIEIAPDGNAFYGKKAIRESWEGFMKMLDEKPVFKPSDPTVRFISPDVALLTWTSEDKVKIQGQEVGGKVNGMAVMHKVNGKWLIEADAAVPVAPPMEMQQSAKN